MSRPDPIQYAERLYTAIRAANFSPISFLAFGNAVKEGVAMRSMPRIAAEPFMRIVGEMLDFEDEVVESDLIDAQAIERAPAASAPAPMGMPMAMAPGVSSADERSTESKAIPLVEGSNGSTESGQRPRSGAKR